MNKKRLLAVVRKMKDRRGNEAVSFLLTTAMLLCIFSTIVMAFCYITQSYHANYVCREVTRRIEVCGEYSETEVTQYLAGASNSDLKNPKIKVDAAYWKEQKIQLRDNFQVTYTADYPIKIVQMGSHDLSIDLPIQIKLTGMSEKYWKDGAADSSTARPKPEQSVELPLNVTSGNQVIVPDSGFALSSVTVLKPEDLIPENIRNGINIGGVTGTLKGGPVIPSYEGSYTITENGTIPLAGKQATQDFVVSVPTQNVTVRTDLIANTEGDIMIPAVGTEFRNFVLLPVLKEEYSGMNTADGLVSFYVYAFDVDVERGVPIEAMSLLSIYNEELIMEIDKKAMLIPGFNGSLVVSVNTTLDYFTYTAVIW